MQNGTLEAPTSTRTTVLDDDMRSVLAQESEFLCASIADHIKHAPDRTAGRPANVLLDQGDRLKVAIALCRILEIGSLDWALFRSYAPEITKLITAARRDFRIELEDDRHSLQAFIVRGFESGHGFVEDDRAASILAYHDRIADLTASIDGCEKFLALVAT